jgi:hypothetical protein
MTPVHTPYKEPIPNRNSNATANQYQASFVSC